MEAGEVGSRVTDGCVTSSRGPLTYGRERVSMNKKKHGSLAVPSSDVPRVQKRGFPWFQL